MQLLHGSRLDKMFFRVAKVLTFAGGQPLTNATGFFFLHDEFLYLITSRHVVISEAPQHRPDRLLLSLPYLLLQAHPMACVPKENYR